jgi:hypothetical protein
MQLPELETLSIEVLDEGVAILRTDRPDRLNSQTVRMFEEYGVAARALRDSGLRALVLTGTGDRAFCAGFDLAEIGTLTAMGTLEFLAFQETATNGIQAIRHLPFPVIAAVRPRAGDRRRALARAGRGHPAGRTDREVQHCLRQGRALLRRARRLLPPLTARGLRQGRRDRLHGPARGRRRGGPYRTGQSRRAQRAPARRGARDGPVDCGPSRCGGQDREDDHPAQQRGHVVRRCHRAGRPRRGHAGPRPMTWDQ